jgi:NADPH:quinone reductase
MMPKTDNKGFHPGMREFVLETLNKKSEQLRLHGRKFNYAVFEPNKEGLEYITKMLVEGKILSQVGQIFSLDNIVEAHRVIDSGHTQGKIILSME